MCSSTGSLPARSRVAGVIKGSEEDAGWRSGPQGSILGRVSRTRHLFTDPGGSEIASNAIQTSPRMQFRLLGPLEVDAGSGLLPLGGPKQRVVLAHLLIRANEVEPACAT